MHIYHKYSSLLSSSIYDEVFNDIHNSTILFKLEAMQVQVLISISYISDILLCRCMSSEGLLYVHAVGLHIHVLLHHICIRNWKGYKTDYVRLAV